MKNLTTKKTAKILTPLSAFAAMIALGVPSANAQSVFNYDFPASWGGSGSTITDLSSGSDNGTYDGTLSLSSALPPGATAGDKSLVTTAGGILTSKNATLNNAAIATADGFTFDVAFMWNGTDKTASAHTQKLIDYSGTESLQLVTTASGTASLQTAFANNAGVDSVANSTTINANTWYNVAFTFDTTGNVVDGTGALAGTANLYVNGALISSVAAVKGDYGDGLGRPIGIGQLGARFGYLVGFTGDIYNPSVSLGVVTPTPEPSTTALLGMFGGLSMAWKMRRRKQ